MKFLREKIKKILQLSEKNSIVALKDILRNYGVFDFCVALSQEYGRNTPQKMISRIISINKLMPCEYRPIKTIGIFYYHMDIGGVQRVISRQINIFRELGYKVVIFTTESPCEKDYYIGDTPRVVINKLDPNSSLKGNAEKFVSAMKEYNIDLFYTHAFGDVFHVACFLLLTKFSLKIPCFVHYHNVFSYSLCHNAIHQFCIATEWLKMADLVLSLSRIDCLYFQSQGMKSVYLPNPPSFDKLPDDSEKISDGKTVLFLARIEHSQKRPCDAVEIIEKVISQIPDAKLIIVGCGSENDEKRLLERIEKSPVRKNIFFKGYSLNVVDYLHNSDVFLCTSTREGYPMTLMESLCCGLPVVTYDMPYLEVIRADSGIITVPQFDTAAAADEIINLLENPHKRGILSEKAKRYGEELFKFDHIQAWSDIIKNFKHLANDYTYQINDVGIMLNTLKFQLWLGDTEKGNRKKDVIISQKNKQLLDIQMSLSFKIGRCITFIPRKIRDIMRFCVR